MGACSEEDKKVRGGRGMNNRGGLTIAARRSVRYRSRAVVSTWHRSDSKDFHCLNCC